MPMTNDRLQQMLNSQRHLQEETYGRQIVGLVGEPLMECVRTNVLALEDELHEALSETGWKPWASSTHMNVESFRSELVDVWHFFMNLMLAAGMSADDLEEGYYAKRSKNVIRQQLGYDGVGGKCPVCHRALDDAGVTCTPTQCGDETRYIEEEDL